jgi:hypothetical protein
VHEPGDPLRDRVGADAGADPADPAEVAAIAVEAGREPSLKEMMGSDAFRQDVISQIGGWRGMAESAVPVLVFIVVNMAAGLRPAIWASVSSALAIALWRLARRQSPRQALNGLFGVGLAAFLAARTGKAEAFYLPGILLGLVYSVAFVGSALARWPLIGVVWGFLTGHGTGWRTDRRLLRLFTWLTVMWGAVWAIRIGIQAGMYLAGASATALGVARLALGYPVLIGLVVVTIWVVRRQNLPVRVASEGA